jgi:hypothetical protein
MPAPSVRAPLLRDAQYLESMRSLLAAVALGLLLVAPASSAAPAPTVSATYGPPLTLAGRGFVPREQVTIVTFVDGPRTATVVAGRNGTFVARLAVPAQTCVFWRATVRGSRSGSTTLLAPTVDCRPEPGASGAVGATPRTGTGIVGSVRRGPIRPVCVAELPCDGPAAGVVVEVESGRATIALVRTGADGNFVVHAPPGTYVVRAVGERAASAEARVRAGAFSSVSLSVDTGIR